MNLNNPLNKIKCLKKWQRCRRVKFAINNTRNHTKACLRVKFLPKRKKLLLKFIPEIIQYSLKNPNQDQHQYKERNSTLMSYKK